MNTQAPRFPTVNGELQGFHKVVRIGRVKGYPNTADLFCKIELRDSGELSITGVEGPMRNGDARGGCGQIVMHEWDITEYAPGWDAALVTRFREVWSTWHLNHMQAGSPAQTAFLKANPITDWLNHYGAACAALEAAGLNPDPNYLHEGKPYRYGSAWLRVALPAEVVTFLQSLPATDITPAWV